jgi:tetratricopeptide (TPR) repeat protein
VSKLIEEGLGYEQDGKWDDAIRAFSRAVALNPRSAEAFIDMGDTYMSAGKYKEGFAAYQQAVHVAPWDADAHYSLGAAYNDMAQYGDAFKPFVQAINLDPNYAEAYYGIGYAYQQLENYKDAAGYLKQAVRIKPDYPEAHLALGLTYFGLGEIKAAEEQLRVLEGSDASLAKELDKAIHKTSEAAQSQQPAVPVERVARDAPGPREKTQTAANRRTQGDENTPPQRAAPSSSAASLLAIELSFWESIKNSDDPEEFAAYLSKYPEGQFAELARIRVHALESRKSETGAKEVARQPETAQSQPTPAQAQTPPAPQLKTPPAQAQPTPAPAQTPPEAPAEVRKDEGGLSADATLEETMDWIRKNFSHKFAYKYTTSGETPNDTPATVEADVNYEPLKFEGCRIEWRDLNDTLSVSLTELDPNSVKVELRSKPNTTFSTEVWNLSITATDGKGSIREVKGDGSGAVNNYSGLDLQFDNKDRAEKFARALQSAIKLCGGKAGP